MSTEHVVAAWRQAPQDVRGADLLVLIRLGDNVMSDDGFGIMNVLTAAEMTRESEERVNLAITYLANKGIIEIVPDNRPTSPWKYPWINFRFTSPENWV